MKTNYLRNKLALVVSLSIVILFGVIAYASGIALPTDPDLVCTGGAIGGTFHNVVVPAGSSCLLDGARVTGDVTVQAGGSLVVFTITGTTTIAVYIKGDR